ncbi:Uncharacterized protein BM_BM14200 [Brugia malayi]|uniref:Bm14200 n=1 Tax=Brugia malayi TaxID=6279 RepID=A0A0J9XU98_BRUMA|nr:Uncharacterized protein BM_BM14200 [Brugia malayi]CDP95837.1 Bm14200 [Brugia malayi]VIO89152.1 Uncharacterized protein BM_BM14200 [Brugia malayi]
MFDRYNEIGKPIIVMSLVVIEIDVLNALVGNLQQRLVILLPLPVYASVLLKMKCMKRSVGRVFDGFSHNFEQFYIAWVCNNLEHAAALKLRCVAKIFQSDCLRE